MWSAENSIEVDDRVICIESYDGNDLIVGRVGTARHISDDGQRVGVEFDDFVGGHDLSGGCEHGHGWWIPAHLLDKEEPVVLSMSFNDAMCF